MRPVLRGGGVFVTCWTFRTTPELRAAFAKAYGPEGDWVALLRQAPGYVGTETYKDAEDADRYMVVDRWRDEESFRAFRRERANDYRALDNRCMDLTSEETKVGHFVAWDGGGG
jgi:heme-degrading monooxygenase HmoA